MNTTPAFDTIHDILLWILLVLAMGFIAYVGRFGAQWLIERWRARRGSGKADEAPASKEDAKARAKLEKKHAKAGIKAEKKRRS